MSFYWSSAVSLTKSKPYTVEIVIQAMDTIGFPPLSGFYKPLQLSTTEEQDVLAAAMTLRRKRKLKELEVFVAEATIKLARMRSVRASRAFSTCSGQAATGGGDAACYTQFGRAFFIERNKATSGCNQ